MTYKPPVSEPIAIVGVSCRFPGGATSPSKLWDVLTKLPDLSRAVPSDRFHVGAFYHPNGSYHGTTNARKAYWLDHDPRAFDASFFGIPPREAEAMDPQQWLLLEIVHEALESCGYSLSSWGGQDVGVFVGAMACDFDTVSQRDDLCTSPHYATGSARSILANRISYFYDFRGPSMTLDTACSSSLVALHQAVLSLRAGDCWAACVAGVNVMLTPEPFVIESSMRMLSPSGHCRMWDAAADGYARGEGAAVLLLKPLTRALREGDAPRIQAIIRETGVASDGRTAGITVPHPAAQAALIRATYRRAGLDPNSPHDRCQYFEAHGTGTPVGDPREAQAIHSAFFGKWTSPDFLVGSIKTIIGHSEGAAGLAGVLKAVLAMRHGQVPANLHLTQISLDVAPFCQPCAQGCLRVPTQLQPWPPPTTQQPRRASVNSFGFGGTNAHAILEFFDPLFHLPSTPGALQRGPHVSHFRLPPIPLLLSAHSMYSLRVLTRQFGGFLQNGKGALSDVAWCSYASRGSFRHRLSVTASSTAEAADCLRRPLSDIMALAQSRPPKLLIVFTGQGAQWPGMSARLFHRYRVYRQSIRALDAVLAACPDPPSWTLEREIARADFDGTAADRLGCPAIAQPLCTAVQMGLVDVLRSIGLSLGCVVGHSSGEIAAAYAAGRLSACDAILVAYYRGRSVSSAVGGAMAAVGLSHAEATCFCTSAKYNGRLCVAASNSPNNTTLSGEVCVVEDALRDLQQKGVFTWRLMTDTVYHSHLMAPTSVMYADKLERCGIVPLHNRAASPLWVSSMNPDGSPPSHSALSGPYWVDSMAKPVLFCHDIRRAASVCDGAFDCVVEIGPHPVLKIPVRETLADYHNIPYASLLQRGRRNDTAFSEFLGFMWTRFDPPSMELRGLLDEREKDVLAATAVRLQLPAYPWDHTQTLYRESRLTRQFHFRTQPPYELLGTRVHDDVDGCEMRWRNLLRADILP